MYLKLTQELLDFYIYRLKKNQPKPIIRAGVTVPNVQKCVMVATLTLLRKILRKCKEFHVDLEKF